MQILLMLKSVPANVDITVFRDNRKICTEREQNYIFYGFGTFCCIML